MFWIALTAQLSAPIPNDPSEWANPDDVPMEIMQEDHGYVVGFRLLVDPSGKIQRCRVDLTSGNLALDKHTCKLAQRRARFRAAADSSGRPTYGVYASYMVWWMSEQQREPPMIFGG